MISFIHDGVIRDKLVSSIKEVVLKVATDRSFDEVFGEAVIWQGMELE